MSTQKVHSGTAGKTEKCLSPETLSASLDGEYSFTEEEVSHLQSCTKCKNLYESYKLLDDVLSHTLDVRCPPASLNRIRKKVAYLCRKTANTVLILLPGVSGLQPCWHFWGWLPF